MDFKKKAEQLAIANHPQGFFNSSQANDIEKALKETWNEAIEESAKMIGNTNMRFHSEQEAVVDHILILKEKI